MTRDPVPAPPDPKAPAPLSPEEAHRLDLKTEREARREAVAGQTVRGAAAGSTAPT